jgi:pyrroline-5-carboxylate reductase
MSLKVGFIGSGKIAQTLIKGFIRAGLTAPDSVIASASKNDIGDLNIVKVSDYRNAFEYC